MSTPTDPTAGYHNELQRLHQRIAELEHERAVRPPDPAAMLHAADQHYRLLFEHTPAMYFALLPDGTVLSVNQYGAECLGYDPSELVGRSVLTVFDRADHSTVLSQLATCGANPSRLFEWEIGKIRKDGSSLWVRERAQTVSDGTGRMMILIVCEDITAERQADQSRREAEAAVREMNVALSLAMPGIARLDLDGRYLSVNDYYAAQLGYAASELIGQPWHPTVHPDDQPRAERAYERLRLVGQAEFDALAVRKDGTHFHKQVFMVRITDQAGAMTGHHCFMRNITRRKQSEQEHRMIKERLQHLITTSPTIIYACEPSGNFDATYISDNVFDQLGYRPQEFIEQAGFWADRIHPDDRAHVIANIPNLFVLGYWESDYRFRHKNGTYRWMHDRLRLIRDEAGQPVEIVGSWIDVTDQKAAEQAIRALQEAASDQSLSPDERIRTVLNLGCSRFKMPVGAVTKILDTEVELTHVWTTGTGVTAGARIPLDTAFCGETFRRNEPLCFEHAGASDWKRHPAYAALGLECYLGTKLVGESKAHGTICFFGTEPHPNRFSQADKDFLLLMARWVSGELDRQETEQALQEQEALLRSVIETATDAIFMKDREGRYRFINSSGAAVIGQPVDGIIGRTDLDVFPRDVAGRLMANDRDVLAGQEQRRFETILDVGGQPRTFYAIKTPHRDQQGTIIGLVGVSRDMTDVKRAETALRASELRLQRFVAEAPVGLVILDNQKRLISANKAFCELTGYSEQEILGKTYDFYTHPDDLATNKSVTEAFYRGDRSSYTFEKRYVRKAGDVIWVTVAATGIDLPNHEGPLLLAAVQNITERKRAEEGLQRAEKLYRTIFEQAGAGVAQIHSATGRFVQVNRRYCDIVGRTEAEMLATDFMSITHPDDLAGDLENMADLRSGSIESFTMEKRYFRNDGSTVWVSLNVAPLWNRGEAPNSHIAVVQDITDRKQAEEQRERLSRDLHDNLLQSLYAVGMQLEASRLASAKQAKTYVTQAIGQLNQLVHDVRNFISSLKHRTIPRQNLEQALRQLVGSLSFAESSAPQLALEPEAVAAIRPDHVDHVVNIAREALSNSLRHARAGHRWIRLCRTDAAVRLVIADDGVGFQLSDTRRQGHGLEHMAERAKLIGAYLHIVSAPGQGTSITMDLPVTQKAADA